MDARTTAGAILVVVGALGATWWDHTTAARAEHLLELSSGASGRIRDVDRLALACATPLPQRTPALAALDVLRQDQSGAALVPLLDAAARCLNQDACTSCLPPTLKELEAHYVGALAGALQQQRKAQQDARTMFLLGCWAWCVAVLGLWWSKKPAAVTAPPAPTPVRDEHALEDVLRARLEELYAQRLRGVAADRFAYFGEVAAGLSHGLKTPLAGMRAAASVALAKLPPDHAAVTNLTDIQDAVDGLTAQIKEFLAGARMGGPVLALVTVDQLLEGPVTQSISRAQARGVRVVVPSEKELRVEVDAGLVQLALANLLDNAVGCSPPGATVTITAARTQPPARAGLEELPPPQGPWLELAVLDDGPGVTPALAAGAVVTSGNAGGSGLGVAITRRIVLRHGGALRFTSRDKGGTSAAILLPLAGAP